MSKKMLKKSLKRDLFFVCFPNVIYSLSLMLCINCVYTSFGTVWSWFSVSYLLNYSWSQKQEYLRVKTWQIDDTVDHPWSKLNEMWGNQSWHFSEWNKHLWSFKAECSWAHINTQSLTQIDACWSEALNPKRFTMRSVL